MKTFKTLLALLLISGSLLAQQVDRNKVIIESATTSVG